MSNERPPSTGLGRVIRHRAVLVIAIVWLICDFALLPSSAGAKRWLRETRQYLLSTSGPAIDIEFVVWRDGDTLRLDRRKDIPSTTVGFVYVMSRDRLEGWWAPTSEGFDISLLFSPHTMAADPEIKRLLAAQIEQLPGDRMATYARWRREGRTWERRTLWLGNVRNAAAVFFALVLVAALVARAKSLLQWLEARHRMARRACPVCKYDLRGDFASGCPECGWRRT